MYVLHFVKNFPHLQTQLLIQDCSSLTFSPPFFYISYFTFHAAPYQIFLLYFLRLFWHFYLVVIEPQQQFNIILRKKRLNETYRISTSPYYSHILYMSACIPFFVYYSHILYKSACIRFSVWNTRHPRTDPYINRTVRKILDVRLKIPGVSSDNVVHILRCLLGVIWREIAFFLLLACE